jgi:hypothetical protein
VLEQKECTRKYFLTRRNLLDHTEVGTTSPQRRCVDHHFLLTATMLWMMLELLKLKACNGWSTTSFSTLLELLTKVLLRPDGFLTITYLAKKIICSLTLGEEKVHACLNHCILYRKEHKFKVKCPTCSAMQVDTNGTMIVTWLRMIPTKKSNKRQGQKRNNIATNQGMQESKERNSYPCYMVPICDRALKAYVLQSEGCSTLTLTCEVQNIWKDLIPCGW